jgi:pilus assembly protein CpaE
MNDSGIEGRGEMSESDIARGQIDKLRPLPRISIQAFFETEGLLRTIERCGEDRRMAKVNLRVNKG